MAKLGPSFFKQQFKVTLPLLLAFSTKGFPHAWLHFDFMAKVSANDAIRQ